MATLPRVQQQQQQQQKQQRQQQQAPPQPSPPPPPPPLCVGLDVGTSAVKLVVIDAAAAPSESPSDAAQPLAPPLYSCQHAVAYDPAWDGHRTQDPLALLRIVRRLLQSVPAALQPRVARVGIAGQMHGCVLWDRHGRPVTRLVTWEDQRCTPEFLAALRRRISGDGDEPVPAHHTLHSGYGCATLAWWAAQRTSPDSDGGGESASVDFSRVAGCGTVMDFVALALATGVSGDCDSASGETGGGGGGGGGGGADWGVAHMDRTNAASWGLFDLDAGDWDGPALDAAGIPRRIMPKVVDVGGGDAGGKAEACAEEGGAGGSLAQQQAAAVVGISTAAAVLGLDSDECGKARAAAAAPIVVHVAVGDHPASVYATMPRGPCGAGVGLLNVGTSMQFSALLPRAVPPVSGSSSASPSPVAPAEARPFFHGRRLLVAAALSGGNSLATFASSVQGWVGEVLAGSGGGGRGGANEPPPLDAVFAALNRSGAALLRDDDCGDGDDGSDGAGAAAGRATGNAAGPAGNAPAPFNAAGGSGRGGGDDCTGDELSSLQFDPRFGGERGAPRSRAALRNISADNFTLGGMWQALQHGLAQNLLDIVGGRGRLRELRLRRVVCVGGAVTRNPGLVRNIQSVFGVPASVAESTGYAGAMGVAHLVSSGAVRVGGGGGGVGGGGCGTEGAGRDGAVGGGGN